MKKRTISAPVELAGTALHSGAASKLRFAPAEEGIGIVFVRADLPSRPRIPASAENVSDTLRGTTLSIGPASVQVIEHVLAAVHAMSISDLLIEMFSGEPPAMDGSAAEFLRALKTAGIANGKEENIPFAPKKEIVLQDGDSTIKVCPADRFVISFVIDFPGTPIGRQEAHFEMSEETFAKEIAPARTFGFLEEIDALKKKGLARGATTENALAISRSGYVNKPRFKDEAVRHKVLDLVGDLALVGKPLKAHFMAQRSSHRLNTQLALMLLREAK